MEESWTSSIWKIVSAQPVKNAENGNPMAIWQSRVSGVEKKTISIPDLQNAGFGSYVQKKESLGCQGLREK